ncbi:hypothetical protein KRMM14A1259_25270 [Krasilnikovia sp. MM14-A1259]
MHAPSGNVGKHGELVLTGQMQLQAWRDYGKTELRPEIDKHAAPPAGDSRATRSYQVQYTATGEVLSQ